jgi:TM2 domain-containing membrane protein YozV
MSSEPTTQTIETPLCAGCNKPLSDAQRVEHGGKCYCAECVGKALSTAAAKGAEGYRDPILAAVLSFLPGLGQMYNRQLIRGAAIMALFFLFTGGHGNRAPFIVALMAWSIFDAYWGAKRINQSGLTDLPPIEELRFDPFPAITWKRFEEIRLETSIAPAWGVLLIILGILFLLNNFDVLQLSWDNTWPMALLGTGVWLLISFCLSRRALNLSINTYQESQNGELKTD